MTTMNATREALLSHGLTHDVKKATAEVERAEAIEAALRELVEAYWRSGSPQDARPLLRKAERLLDRPA